MSKALLLTLSVLIACCVCLVAVPSTATTWDAAAADFSVNGGASAWSYGYVDEGQLNSNTFTAYAAYGTFGPMLEWAADDTDNLTKGGIWKNPSPDPVYVGHPAWYAGNQLGYHPGVADLARPTIRWTAPESGSMLVSVTVSGADLNGSSSEGHIRHNGTVLWGGNVNGYAGTPPTYEGASGTSPSIEYSDTIQVTAGDTIDLVGGSQGAIPADSTRWSFVISTGQPGVVSGVVKFALAGSSGIAGVPVTISPGSYSPAITDGSGNYSFTVPAGDYTVSATYDGFPAAQAAASVTSGQVTTADILIPAGKFTGTIISSEAGNPPIELASIEAVGTSFSAATDAAGQYSLIVPPGTYTLRFSKPNFEPVEVSGVEISSGQEIAQNQQLVRSASTTWDAAADFSLTINGSPSVWSYGYCNDNELEGAAFTAYTTAGTFGGVLSEWSMDTDDSLSKGAIWKNPTADVLSCSWPARYAGYQLGYHSGVADLARPTIRWTAPEAGSVLVTATVSGADYIDVTSTEGHIRHNGTVLWGGNVNGYGGDPPDYANAFGASPSIAYSGVIEVADGDTIDLVGGSQGAVPGDSTRWSFVITTAETSQISGKVRFDVPGSAGIPGLPVTITPGSYPAAVTDGDGNYSFTVLPGDYTLAATYDGFPPAQATVTTTAGQTTTADILIPAGKFAGTVLSSQAGNPPIERAHVEAVGTAFIASTNAAGEYALIVPPGTYTLRFSKPGFETFEVPDVEIASGEVIANSPVLAFLKEVWDANFDFSPTGAVIGEWTYGYTDAAETVVPYDVTEKPLPNTDIWRTDVGEDNQDKQDNGFIGKHFGTELLNSNNMMYEPIRGFYEPGQLFCFPSEDWAYRSTIRWTAPKSAWFIVHVLLSGQTMALSGATADGTLRDQDFTELYTCNIRGFAGTSAWEYGDRFGDSPVCEAYRYAYVPVGGCLDLIINDTGNTNDFDLTGVVFTVETAEIEPGTVEGYVTSALDGSYLEGIEIIASDARFKAVTDANGYYSMQVPSWASTTLTATGVGYSTASKTISVPANTTTSCDFQLQGARLQGYVTKAGSGEPIYGAMIKTSDGAHTTYSDYDGSYRLPVVGDTYDITAFYPGYVTQTANITINNIISRDFTMSEETTIDADLAEDFLVKVNPNSYWTYGYYFAGFDPLTWLYYDAPATAVPGEVLGWGDPFNVNGGFMVKNFTNSIRVYYVPMPAGTLQWHPGWSDARPTAIWTAPKAAKVMVSSSIAVCDPPGAASTTAIVRHNGNVLASGSINGLGQPGWSSSNVVDIAQGDTIEFCLTWGDNAAIPGDSTRYDGHIAEVSLIDVSSIVDLKGMDDGSYVRLTSKVAACDGLTFTDGFYVQEENRTSGVKIVPNVNVDGVVAGSLITATGVLLTDAAGQRYIEADSVQFAPGLEPKSVGVNNRGFATIDTLLTTVWGNVTAVDTTGHQYFYVDDGSMLTDGSGNVGLRIDVSKVAEPAAIQSLMDSLTTGKTISVTGIAGREVVGEGTASVVRPRSASDINTSY